MYLFVLHNEVRNVGSKGFAILEPAQKAQNLNKKEKGYLASIDEIQNNLLSSIEEI